MTDRWRTCARCDDEIGPGEHVYPAGDSGSRVLCAVCKVKAGRERAEREGPAEPARECAATYEGWTCERERGHAGRHAAGSGATWADADDFARRVAEHVERYREGRG